MSDQNLKSAVDILSETPPPDEPIRERTRSGKLKFLNVAKANARMVELQEALGLPPRPPIWNVAKANARVEQLEEMLAVKGLAEPASPRSEKQVTAAPAVSAVSVEPIAEANPVARPQDRSSDAFTDYCVSQVRLNGQLADGMLKGLDYLRVSEIQNAIANDPAARKRMRLHVLKSKLPGLTGLSKRCVEAKIAQTELEN